MRSLNFIFDGIPLIDFISIVKEIKSSEIVVSIKNILEANGMNSSPSIGFISMEFILKEIIGDSITNKIN